MREIPGGMNIVSDSESVDHYYVFSFVSKHVSNIVLQLVILLTGS